MDALPLHRLLDDQLVLTIPSVVSTIDGNSLHLRYHNVGEIIISHLSSHRTHGEESAWEHRFYVHPHEHGCDLSHVHHPPSSHNYSYLSGEENYRIFLSALQHSYDNDYLKSSLKTIVPHVSNMNKPTYIEILPKKGGD